MTASLLSCREFLFAGLAGDIGLFQPQTHFTKGLLETSKPLKIILTQGRNVISFYRAHSQLRREHQGLATQAGEVNVALAGDFTDSKSI